MKVCQTRAPSPVLTNYSNKRGVCLAQRVYQRATQIAHLMIEKGVLSRIFSRGKRTGGANFRITTSSPRVSKHAAPGFKNLGNTCFINSLLKALIFHNREWIDFLKTDTRDLGDTENLLRTNLINLYEALESRQETTKLLKSIQNYFIEQGYIQRGKQGDAHELFIFLNVALNFEDSPFALSTSLRKIKESNYKNQEYEISALVEKHPIIQIKEGSYLQEAIENDLKEEYCSDPENLIQFSDTSYTIGYKQTYFLEESFPNQIMMQLPRFSENREKRQSVFQLTEQFSIPVCNREGKKQKEVWMKVEAIVCHRGQIHGGHYFSFVRHTDGSWYKHNDESVSGPILFDQVRKESEKLCYLIRCKKT
jgi:ubiquitin C-terminal hydrolase